MTLKLSGKDFSEKCQEEWRKRLRERQERTRAQGELIPGPDLLKETIRMKLSGLFEGNQMRNFERCGNEMMYQTCRNCGRVEELPYSCSLKWCPRCQWKKTGERVRILRKWSASITQPKHLVLTQRNFPVLTRRKIREHKQHLQKFRRTKVFKDVRGGACSVEITNEGNGWHLHSHWLLDVRWLEMPEVSRTWGSLCGQEFGIVKVKDLRAGDYVHECAKYVCEGNAMAQWPPEQILEFVQAIKGCRFFFQFGELLKQAKRIRAELAQERPEKEPCECGCEDFVFETEAMSVLNQIRKEQQ